MAASFVAIPDCAANQPFAECRGVDLSRPLEPQDVAHIRDGLMRHGLLVFRGQQRMTPADEVAFNKAFGWHDDQQKEFLFGFGAPTTEHRVSGGGQLPEWPEVSVLGNVLLDGYHGIHNTQLQPVLGLTYSGWHADGLHDMFDGLPELTTMFNPPGYLSRGGGATLFTSGVGAVDRMAPELAAELARCVVAYARCPNDEAPDEARRILPGPSVMADEGTRRIGFAANSRDGSPALLDFEMRPEHADGGGRHPAILVQPVTGQRSLYISPARAVHLLDGESGAMRHGVVQTAELLSRALLPSVRPGVRYEHVWQEGDFVAWSNTLVLHSATDPAAIEGPRLMHRVRLSTPKRRPARP